MDSAPQRGSFGLEAVSVAFGPDRVLSELSLQVDAGEVVAVVGPSGAGKTTLLHLLNGMIAPVSGTVRVGELDLATIAPRDLRQLRARIGFVHQKHNLIPNLRVVQNVVAGKLGQRGFLESARSMLLPSRADQERAYTLLQRVGIGEKLFQRTDTLSGGQEQRVALARALFQDPVALLADEPVASVDPARARDLIRLMVDLAREEGLTLIACLHDLSLAKEFFPRSIGLRDGRVAFDAATKQVSEQDFDDLYSLARS